MQSFKSMLWALSVLLSLAQGVTANELLDGKVFTGMIGPTENPDLADSLHFSDGYFWSDICTRCGFQPGTYSAKMTNEGIIFTGILESVSHGRFEYHGTVRDDDTIEASIQWERQRWYWASRREFAFQGTFSSLEKITSLKKARQNMDGADAGTNPLCARF